MGQPGQATSSWSEAPSNFFRWHFHRPPPWHDTTTASGLSGSQAETGGKGQESTSRAVHRRVVLPAAGSVVSAGCPLVREAAGALLAALRVDAQNDSRHATTLDEPTAVEPVGKWPRYVVRALPRHDGRSDSPVQ